MGEVISWFSGFALLVFGVMVMIAYRPSKWFQPDAPGCLQAAIFLSFAAAVSNTAYWQVLGQPAIALGVVTVHDFRAIGDWLDLGFKGGAALAGYLHLRAMHLSLPEDERAKWSPLEMAFYPSRRACLRMLAKLLSK